MMRMEADRMINLDLGPEDILTEREVIIEERNQRVENDPGALFREQRNAALYLNHPYGIPIIGWRHEMEQLDLEDALAFYRQFYAPNNAVLVVAGDVEPENVLQLAKDTYGKIPPNPKLQERNRRQEPPHTSARRMTFYDERVGQPYVTCTYLFPNGIQVPKSAAALTLWRKFTGQTSVLTRSFNLKRRRLFMRAPFIMEC